MRRSIAIGAILLLALGGTLVGGIALGRSTAPTPPDGITEAEHDRLVEACTGETDDATGCLAWIGEMVEWAESKRVAYAELTAIVADDLARQQREAGERDAAAQRAHDEMVERDFCEIISDTPAEVDACLNG